MHGKRRFTHEEITKCREELVSRFPLCFFRHEQFAKKPLKKGIHKDIRARWPEVEVALLKTTLLNYVGGRKYTSCMKTGVPRIDLDGEPVGTVNQWDVKFQEHNEYQKLQARKLKGQEDAKRIIGPE